MPVPQSPRNPRSIVGDTSAVLQVLFCESAAPFRVLFQRFDIRCVVVEAVDSELSRLVKNRFRAVEGSLLKCRSAGSIAVLNRGTLRGEMGAAGDTLMDAIDARGSEFYQLGVDRGEAYTHSAAAALGAPVLTHDLKAIRILQEAGYAFGSPVLRAFDLATLALQCNELESRACETLLKELKGLGEPVPRCFQNQSFADGLSQYYPRIQDRAFSGIGSEQPVVFPWDRERIWVEAISGGAF
jgi:hypothetical protein